ncbi:hypothetical protein CBR_g34683 [Chara braunii]|uniref:Uncharacterized protein n=1 Tax=Chara braunii TaxID=69332 RepID=A0A388JYY2_CHABU|nr:hypothetical protein CBR_g34683 [Chara braunii]|eukprot:GBG62982.1 hypothetical protein CBR_g34683 [Chara braunii]
MCTQSHLSERRICKCSISMEDLEFELTQAGSSRRDLVLRLLQAVPAIWRCSSKEDLNLEVNQAGFSKEDVDLKLNEAGFSREGLDLRPFEAVSSKGHLDLRLFQSVRARGI